jgi:phenylalanyl-tRNA synthetase beta chain
MLIPLSWLREFVETELPAEELAERLTLAGLEVEDIREQGEWWDGESIVVGQVSAVRKHPNADRLVIAEVAYGNGQVEQVVTGATNLFQYLDAELPVLKAPFARTGAELIDAYSEARPRPRIRLEPSSIRGVESNGMLCSERELGLGDEHEGILLLPEDAPVGAPLRDYLADWVLDISLTPDMARCLSLAGVAREVAALTGARLNLPGALTTTTGGAGSTTRAVRVTIEDTTLCHRYTAMIVEGVRVGPAPVWMQLRLRQAGLSSHNNVVDITNYVMLELGQPLHAFDYDILRERAARSGRAVPEIIVRTARDGERMTTLDGVERELDQSTLLIADTLGPVAIAGVMGGAETAIHDGTTNVLIESATFDGINNRRTAQRLKLHTDASHRFTRGVPATLNPVAARRAAGLIRLHAGGAVSPEMADDYPVPQAPRFAYLTESLLRRLLGVPVTLDAAAEVLRRLDFAVEESLSGAPLAEEGDGASLGLSTVPGERLLRCTAPWHRLDVQYPSDLIEEVARVIGYERVEATMMVDALPTQRRNVPLESERRIRDILVGCGLQETINYSLTTPENHDKLNVGRGAGAPSSDDLYVTLANPLSVYRRVMRRSLLVSALENLAYNSAFTDRLATFEIGRVYLPEQGDGVRPFEETRLSLLLTGPRRPSSIHPDPTAAEDFDFFDLKGVVETLLRRLGVSSGDVDYVRRDEHGTFTPNNAEVRSKGEPLGFIGELHPRVREAFALPERQVYVAELRVGPLVRPSWQLHIMPTISNYPAVVEDLAFIVAEGVEARRVLDAIRGAGVSFLTAVELFDLYRGEPLPAGHKSLAFQVTYQSAQSTLSEEEVAAARARIVETVTREVGGVMRGA